MRQRKWMPPVFAVFGVLLAALLAACGSSSTSGTASSPSTSAAPTAAAAGQSAMLKTAKTSLGSVLTNSTGFTLYWYAPDTSTASNCNGGCATAWPPVTGKPAASSGVTLTGTLGTITRSDGKTQATYNGHPLYTYAGDHAAGQTTGNGVGGTWHAVTVSAPVAGSPSPSASSGGGGGGY